MSVKEDFYQAWKDRFSTSEFPDVDYLEGTPDQEQLDTAYKSCQTKIQALETELKQQQFISEFLWSLLHPGSPSHESEKGSKNDSGASHVELSANTNGLDAIVPTGKAK